MAKMLTVAANICSRYQETYGEKIDEMKLQKMMYFAQREALIQKDEPLFDATFRGWKYGPVLKELRKPYQENSMPQVTAEEAEELKPVMDVIFDEFADKDSFSLCRLTHGEISWRRSRKGVAPAANSDKPIATDDIRLDAKRIKDRREMLEKHGL